MSLPIEYPIMRDNKPVANEYQNTLEIFNKIKPMVEYHITGSKERVLVQNSASTKSSEALKAIVLTAAQMTGYTLAEKAYDKHLIAYAKSLVS